ncbi:murein DD-endopeptidase MepM/ murein hydrolase activator NlpD [Pasteurella langaaensis DSM 22999]|uniref:Murein DD-endopeptidase MepM/ murein hydrolase activator NlpD n=1 Tax=Alitibacter langaaensis DSM 22999 TaxID=1122935 RepID=A0A2U0TCQ4_9PAST|nr:murein hydrolase activator NlpD [Pasteurella langaaensis]PVX41327.1 murein DD-endopeptidase MepM/ murein hydrolase activator NlpD [Pasteurella langaaensis DSM 22999]
MKKTFLLLPIAAAVLAGCTSSTPAPVDSVDGTLSSQPIQPIETPTTTGSWEPQVQPSAMPAGMNAPVVNQPVANQVGTMANTTAVNQQSQSNQQQTQPAPAAPTTTTKTVCKTVQKTKAASTNQSQSVEIPRNTQTNAPDYAKIDKGFYKANEYTVKKGDTMFLIAYIAGIDVKELASLNGMSEPYTLKVGQTLKVSNGSAAVTTEQQCTEVTVPVQPQVTYTQAANGTQYGSDGTVTGPVKAGVGSSSTVAAPVAGGVVAGVGTAATAATVATTASTPSYSSSTSQTVAPASNLKWQWPTTGKVVQGFSSVDGGNKGIDISGSKGQPIYAAAPGRVVYAGNALRGYGNLIIIKHDNNFLSAYAHNDSISVSDQQEVRAGQQIGKMGSTGTTSTKLHFEIRYQGKSVDPTRYLPRR